jgi:hypothetical protein
MEAEYGLQNPLTLRKPTKETIAAAKGKNREIIAVLLDESKRTFHYAVSLSNP